MQYFPMNYLMHMQNVPKVDRRIVAFGIVTAAALAGGLAWLIV